MSEETVTRAAVVTGGSRGIGRAAVRAFTAADIAFPSIILLMGFLLYFLGRFLRVVGKNRLVIIGLGFFRRTAAENNQ